MGLRSAWPRRRVTFVGGSLVIAAGLAAAGLVIAGSGPTAPVHYAMASRFADTRFHVGGMVINPDGRTLYVIGSENDQPDYVLPISVATGAPGRPIRVGVQPVALAITADGKSLYVANYTSNTVTPIDTATGVPGRPIAVGKGPGALTTTPDGKILYVVVNGSGAIVPVDTATGTPGRPITVGGSPSALLVAPDGKTLYVASQSDSLGDDSVVPVSIATGQQGKPIAMGGDAVEALAVAPDGATLYVAGMASDMTGTVTPVDTATGTLGTPVLVGSQPFSLAISPEGSALYVGAWMGTPARGFSTVSVVNLSGHGPTLASRAVLAGYVEELTEQVRPVDELADAAEMVRREIAGYLRWRFGRWSIT